MRGEKTVLKRKRGRGKNNGPNPWPDIITRLQTERGLTDTQLAAMLNLSAYAVQAWRSGRNGPSRAVQELMRRDGLLE